jgi:CRISPR-associated protein Csd1
MLLQRLVAMHREGDDDGPAHYRDRPMRWQLALRRDGTPASGLLTDLADPNEPTRKFGTSFPVPYTTRTSGVAACLGADDLQYVLGWCDQDSKPDRVAACHSAFVALVRAWAEQAPEDPAANALVAFYDNGQVASVTRPQAWTSKQGVLVVIDGVPVTQSASLQRFWAGEVERRKAGGGTVGGVRRGRCLVCGAAEVVLLDTLPQQLPRRLVLLATQNAALVSANKRIHTYDFSQSLTTVPICAECGRRAVRNLESTLADPKRSVTYGGDSRLVWWTLGDRTIDLNAVLSLDDPTSVHQLLARVRHGSGVAGTGLERDRFCALTVSGNVSRVMVRDWIDMPLSALEANIAAWFDDHELASGHPHAGPHYPLIRLVLAAGRWVPGRDGATGHYAELGAKHAQRPPDITRQLLRAALLGVPLPSSLLGHLVTRARTDRRMDDPRAALLRLLLTRIPNPRTEATSVLDPANRDPAYLAGRVFATLESIQYAVSRDNQPNTTFADRYFAGAVANPRVALVQGRQLATAWLKRIRRSAPGTAVALDRRLTELLDLFDAGQGLPGRIDLQRQAAFLLGYHHQRADDFRQARARAASTAEPPEDQPAVVPA